MNAQIQPLSLSERERAQIRKDLYEQKKRDWLFLAEAINEAKGTAAAVIRMGFESGDAPLFLKGCQQAVIDRIESELAEDAERDLLASKDINGKRYFTA
jgi:hypothetical protein